MGVGDKVDVSKFLVAWEQSMSTFEVSERMGRTRKSVVSTACRLRKAGYKVKYMEKHQDMNRAAIRSEAAHLRNQRRYRGVADTLTAEFFIQRKHSNVAALARETGFNRKTVQRYLESHNLTDLLEGSQVHRLFEYNAAQLAYLDGLILSDATISKQQKGKVFCQTSVSLDWIMEISSFLDTLGVEHRIKNYGKRGGRKDQHVLHTLRYSTFKDFYSRWYPDGGSKRIPHDIQITPPLLRNLYLGDGYMGDILVLCLEGFPNDDVVWLSRTLNSVLSIDAVTYTVGHGLRIKVYAKDRNTFLRFLLKAGDPPPSLAYKIRWVTRRKRA